MILEIDGGIYFASNHLNQTLCERAGVGGVLTQTRQNLVRNLHFADGVFAKNENIHFVYRTFAESPEVTINKLYAAMGSYFKPIPQTILADIAEAIAKEGIMGNQVCEGWTITHEFTDIVLAYPDQAEEIQSVYNLEDIIVPKISLSTSDIGSSSVIVRAKLGVKGGNVSIGECAFKHSKGLTFDKVMKEVDENLFPQFRTLPECLIELLVPVCDADLTTAPGREANMKQLTNLVESVSRKLLYNTKIFGKAGVEALNEAIIDEFDSAISYTYYDIAVKYLSLTKRLDGPGRDILAKMEKTLANAPYVLREKMKKETPSFTILPE